jgi:hypothetical protein
MLKRSGTERIAVPIKPAGTERIALRIRRAGYGEPEIRAVQCLCRRARGSERAQTSDETTTIHVASR